MKVAVLSNFLRNHLGHVDVGENVRLGVHFRQRFHYYHRRAFRQANNAQSQLS